MTDFVDRLLGGPGRSPIRPLIPTLFEPMGRSEPDEPLPLGVFSETATPVATAPDPARSEPSAAPAPPVETRSVTVPSVAGTPSVHVTQPPAQQTIEMHTVTQNLHTHHNPATAVAARRTPAPTTPSAEPVMAQRHPAVTSQSSAPPVVVAAPTAVSTVHHHETVIGRAEARRAPRRPSPAAEPDVQISIGRVEIRAGQDGSVARQRTDSRKSPRLSLDDYLRGREVDRR